MKIVCVMACSVDGRITHGDCPLIHLWTSDADKKHLSKMVSWADVIVFGSKTYEAYRGKINYNNSDKLRIVLTRDLPRYEKETIPGRLEFTSQSPRELIERLKKQYDKVLLTGGSVINGLFFRENLVDELYLTVEPKIFGSGAPVVSGNFSVLNLVFRRVEKLNKKGSLLLKYKVVR